MTTNAAELDRPAAAIGGEATMRQASSENFSVATRLLPARVRAHLLSVYGYCRFVDDLGDEAPGDRLALLDWAERELDAAFAGESSHPIFVALQPTILSCGLDRQTLLNLIEANRVDQVVTRYETFADLVGYCELSANPVGRLVLSVFGATSEASVTRSNEICTALQVVEHLQDVGEDRRAGRVYLPLEDLSHFGASQDDLDSESASPALRRTIAFEAGRTRELLERGAPLVGMLSGTARIAIAGFVAGGLAQLDALERAQYDVLAVTVKASKASIARHTIGRLRRSR